MNKFINFILINFVLSSMAYAMQSDAVLSDPSQWKITTSQYDGDGKLDLWSGSTHLGYLKYYWQDKKIAVLRQIFVYELYRQHHCGTTLFQKFIEHIKSNSPSQIKWEIFPTHTVEMRELKTIYDKWAGCIQRVMPGSYEVVEEEVNNSDSSLLKTWGIFTVKSTSLAFRNVDIYENYWKITVCAKVADKEEYAGFIAIKKDERDAWFLEKFKIKKKFRHQGIGTELFKQAFLHCKNMNPKLHMISWTANPQSRKVSLDELAEIYKRLCKHVQCIVPGKLEVGAVECPPGDDPHIKMSYIASAHQ